MKKSYLLLLALGFALTFVSCIKSIDFPECNNRLGDCTIVRIANDHGVCLDQIGNGLIIANAVCIGNEAYTRQQAAKAIQDVISVLDEPITALAFKVLIDSKIGRFPGMLEVSSIYLSYFDGEAVLDTRSRDIVKDWLKTRVLPVIGV